MNNRETRRFSFLDNYYDKIDRKNIYFELEMDGPVKGEIVDLSLKGIGFEIHGLDQNKIETIRKQDEFFIKIFFEDDFYMAGVKNIWGSVESNDGKIIYKGGLKIEIISSEDNLKLLEYIENLRDSGTNI